MIFKRKPILHDRATYQCGSCRYQFSATAGHSMLHCPKCNKAAFELPGRRKSRE
jgi:Zn finger protein HypA/HybF involved in hydrogenase expression